MSLYAFFCYADLYIIVEYGIFLKKIQFPVQRGANYDTLMLQRNAKFGWLMMKSQNSH